MTRLVFIVAILLLINGCSKAPEAPRKPTAQDNIQVLEQEFVITGLDRSRTIRLYLPPDYVTETEYYPVIYMHDGQNLFDDATSYAGEWKVDETLNQIAQQTGKKFIVVGIDNGQEHRMNELSPWPHEDFLPAEGDAYLTFITDVVKPYIDTHYRTQGGRNHTAIMGSSMGGLMSHYALYKRPDVFSKAGIYSPSYWFSQQSFEFTQQHPLPSAARLDFIVGEKEGGKMVKDMLSMTTMIEKQKRADVEIRQRVVADAEHNEGFWSEHFGQTVLWLFSE